MAPEQWKGAFQDAHTDQYAFAVTIYEMLSRHVVFNATDYNTMMNCALHAKVKPLTELNDKQNAALIKALAKNPSERFDNYQILVNNLVHNAAIIASNITTKPPLPMSKPEITSIASDNLNNNKSDTRQIKSQQLDNAESTKAKIE